MTREEKEAWSLAELAEETGMSPRTIRYYISRGLVEGPAVAGRGAVYQAAHLEKLRRIRDLQSRGAMLGEIGRMLSGRPECAALPSPEPWHRYPIDSDIVVLVRSDVAPWRQRQLRKALGELATKIQREKQNDDPDGDS